MKQSLSPKELASAIGVSESSLKRWADSGRIQVSRTLGGHRRIQVNSAIRFIRSAHLPILRPEILGLSELQTVREEPDQDPSEQLHDLLLEGESLKARGLLLNLFLTGHTLPMICDGPMSSAMRRIGTLYEDREEGTFLEHRATDICSQAIQQIRIMLEPDESEENPRPTAVGGCPAGDYGALGSAMAAATLSEAGFETIHLGANTPIVSYLNAIETHRPRVVFLACTHSGFMPSRHDLEQLSSAASHHRGCIVLGGHATEIATPHTSHNIYHQRSMSELAAFAEGLIASYTQDQPKTDQA